MKNLNLIRKLAWTFAEKTNIEYQELFGEASLAYCQAVADYNPDRGTKLTTYAYTYIKNRLINFCKEQTMIENQNVWCDEFPENIHPTTEQGADSAYNVLREWVSKDAEEVVGMVLGNPERYMAATPNFRRWHIGQKRRLKIVERDLVRKGWAEARIQSTIQSIQYQL